MTKLLDHKIIDASSLVSILLVFVFAYFSALLPQFESMRAQPRPNAEDDRRQLERRLLTYQLIGGGLAAVVLLVFLLLLPLSVNVIRTDPWTGPFDTLRFGLLLAELLVAATAAALLIECILLGKRRRQLHH